MVFILNLRHFGERLDEASRKKSEVGKQGGNPSLKQRKAEVKQSQAEVKQSQAEVEQSQAEVKPNAVTDTIADTVVATAPAPPKADAAEPLVEAAIAQTDKTPYKQIMGKEGFNSAPFPLSPRTPLSPFGSGLR